MTRPILVAALVVACAGAVVAGRPAESPARAIAGDLAIRSFAFCPDGRTIAAWDGKAGWTIDWPAGTVRPPQDVAASAKRPQCAAPGFGASPDGKSWALAQESGPIRVEELSSGALIRMLTGHVGGVAAVAFSPDGAWLASAGADNDVRVWNARTWEPATAITDQTHTAFALVWTPDGRQLIAGGASRDVTAWQAGSWTHTRTSPSLKMVVGALAISHDGRRLAAGLYDGDDSHRPGAIAILDPATLEVRATIATPAGVMGLEFAPDNDALVGVMRGAKGLVAWPLGQ